MSQKRNEKVFHMFSTAETMQKSFCEDGFIIFSTKFRLPIFSSRICE